MPTLEITTRLGCALACRFCPQDRLVKAYPKGDPRDLSLIDFIHVLDKLPRHVRVDFSGMSEPWLNPHATAMAVYAFECERQVAIYTTLQGMAPDDAVLLIEGFGDRISPETPWVLHLPDGDGHMTGWRPSESYRATLAHFLAFQRRRPRPGLSLMTMSADGAVAEPLRDLVPERLTPFVGISRVENLDRAVFTPSALLAQVRHTAAVMCASTPFFDHNTMLPNGDVLLCCMDYGQGHVLGNLLRQSYEEIHAGPAMGAVRVRAMAASDGPLICRRCHNAVGLDRTIGAGQTGGVGESRGTSQAGATHWTMFGPTMWTPPPAPPPAPVAPQPRIRLRTVLQRVLPL